MEKDIPIEYNVYNNKFYIVDRSGGYNNQTFIDQDSFEKFKSFNKKDAITLDLHKQGFNLPVFKTKYCAKFWNDTFLTIYKPYLPLDTPFSDKNYTEYCKVLKQSKKTCVEYTLQFADYEVKLYHHKKYPFSDFTIHGLRYRWIEFSTVKHNNRIQANYKFTLYELNKEQDSLVSDLQEGTVNSNNVIASKFIPTKWYQTINVGDLESLKSHKKIGQCDLVDYKLSGKRAVFDINLANDIRSINDVPEDIMMYLIMVSIFKLEEDIREMTKAALVAN